MINQLQKHGNIYNYKTFYTKCNEWEGFVYEIYTQTNNKLTRESSEWFDTSKDAEIEAINHISLLENGEG